MHASAQTKSMRAANHRSVGVRPQSMIPAAGAAAGSTHRLTPQSQIAVTRSCPSIASQKHHIFSNPQRRVNRFVTGATGPAASDAEVLDTVVVGAGISGLVTAQALATKHGDKVTSFLVTEGRERVGGNITSMQADGYVWEEGPNSFQPNDAMLQAAVSDVWSARRAK